MVNVQSQINVNVDREKKRSMAMMYDIKTVDRTVL